MSEQSAEQISGEPGSFSPMAAVSDSSEASVQPIVAAPGLVPGQDAAMSDAPTTDAPKSDVTEAGATKTEAPQADPSKVDPSKADTPKAASPRFAGKVLIMSDDERNWEDDGAAPEIAPEPDQGMFGKRWLAVAAMLALAVVAGALGGAMATAGLSQFFGDDVASADSRALEASIARIDADILALKAGVEHTSKLAASQYTRTSDRLDKVEKAQAEPAAKLARLSEAVDKLRATPPAAAAPGAAKEVTGSVTPPVPTPAPKPEVGRLPTVEGWVLHDVANGGALIEGRHGRIYEVYPGDPLPGLGRVDAIRRQDGRWAVVTSKGLIVAR